MTLFEAGATIAAVALFMIMTEFIEEVLYVFTWKRRNRKK